MNKILIVDDDKNHRTMLKSHLAEWGWEVAEAENGKEALASIEPKSPAAILLDARMPIMDGFETLRELRQRRPEIPAIMMTAYSDISGAVDAMRSGAYDYQTKPLDLAKLKIALDGAISGASPRRKSQSGNYGIIGDSQSMRDLIGMIGKIGPTNATVLIQGESGSGKELVAKALHMANGRKNGPFVAVNCGALTPSLAVAELFGHEKGAFTGADRKRRGLFAEANGGTIFLDEIGEAPPELQVKLLRVLQEKEVLPAGGSRPIPVNCRIIAATNRDLVREVKKGTFREDLYYRLNVMPLSIPPLRERRSDIPLMAAEFARKFAKKNGRKFEGFSKEALMALSEYEWPGNARELENAMERSVILMPGEYIGLNDLPDIVRSGQRMKAPDKSESAAIDDCSTLEEVEKNVILRVLEKTGYNKSETARMLGISRKTLHTKLA
ncbi:MAG: sigma-54 dependent transcriptional regulator, partial [Desulfovibrio sp.]|nr:sigma-54 dependent transcriptional regulator [Desulfovibrio sp.]